MADIAGITGDSIAAWSQRSTQLREWAANNLTVVDSRRGLSQAQLAAAQKATRPRKPESLSWAELRHQWRADERGLVVDRAAHDEARAARRAAAAAVGGPRLRQKLWAAAEGLEKAAFTRADLAELIGAQLPINLDRSPRAVVLARAERCCSTP